MRIMHVINHTGRFNGNVHAAVDLACAQSELGHAVMMCSAGGDFDPDLRAAGVEIAVLPLKRRSIALTPTAFAMGRLMRRWRADVVHAHMVASALAAYPGCRITNRALVTTVHNAFEKSAKIMRIGHRVIAVSATVSRSMVGRGIPGARLRTVLNGTIGSARFRGPRPEAMSLVHPAILFVGGLHPRKGVADLLEAFALVHGRHPDARLHLVGEGPCEAEYRARAAALPCGGAISFCGSQLDPRPFMLGADILVLPSLADPAPLVLSEARDAGCAIVATAVDGIPEMLEDGRAGILVPAGSPVRLADAVGALLDDPKALADWRARSQINIGRMSLSRVARDTVAVYDDAIGDLRRGRWPVLGSAQQDGVGSATPSCPLSEGREAELCRTTHATLMRFNPTPPYRPNLAEDDSAR